MQKPYVFPESNSCHAYMQDPSMLAIIKLLQNNLGNFKQYYFALFYLFVQILLIQKT